MKKINVWLTVFYGSIVLNVIGATFFRFGTALVGDVVHLLGQLAFGVSGICILYKISKRDPSVYENETLRTLIYYKEHSKKQKNFPLSASLMLVFAIMVIAILATYGIMFYVRYFVK